MGARLVIDLYIIHGWTYTTEPWNKTLSALKEKGINAKILRVPGLTEPSNKIWSIKDYAKWAEKNIPNDAIALGHSNGGRILLNLASQNPKKMKYMILLDSAGVYEPTTKKLVVEKLAKIGKPLRKIKIIDKIFHRLTGSTDYSKAPTNMKKTLQNMLASDKNLNLTGITTKTFILWGKKDTITPPRQATKLYESLPNAELRLYDDWTHAPYISNPNELADAIANLITKLRK